MHTRLLLLLAVLLLTLTACVDGGIAIRETSGSEEPVLSSELPVPSQPATPSEQPIPVEPDGGIGDQPIPVEPDGGIGDGAQPLPGAATDESQTPSDGAPPFGVSSETQSMVVQPFGYCWTAGDVGLCADGQPSEGDNPLIGADQLIITYEPGSLTATAGPLDSPEAGFSLSVNQDDTGVFLVDTSDLPEGEHTVTLFWNGEQGDSSAVLTLTIDRA